MTRRTAIVVAFAATMASGVVGAQDDASAVRTFQLRRFEAMTRHRFNDLAGLLGDELVYTHTDGSSQTKTQFLQTLRSGEIAYDAIEPTDVQVRVYGHAAVVTGESMMHIRTGSQPQTFAIKFIEVDVRRNGRWQMVAWQSTRTVP